MSETKRRVQAAGGDVPRGYLFHPELVGNGMTREFIHHAGGVLSRRKKRMRDEIQGPMRRAVLRQVVRRQRLELELLCQSWKGGWA